jgi:hypothetical protein
MKMRLIAIAAIALSPAVVLGQTRTHIRVAKDGTHSTTTQQTNGDVYTTPAPAAQPTPAPDTAMAPTPAAQPTPAPDTAMAPTTPPADTTAPKTDSSQLGTGAAAPTPTHSQQSDSSMTPMSDSSTMRTDSTTSTTTTTPVDTVRVPRNSLQVSPTDSAKIGIPSTRQMEQRADSLRRSADTTTTTTPPPR